MAFPVGSDTTIPLKPEGSPLKSRLNKVPHPAGTTPPVNEKPKTVEELFETVKPLAEASPPGKTPLMVASLTFMSIGLFLGLFIAPTDYQQGDSYRIMFIHVPCAILSLFLYLILGVNSFIFLVWKFKMNDLINN